MKTVIAMAIMSMALGAASSVVFGCCTGHICKVKQAPGVMFDGRNEVAVCVYSAEHKDLVCLTPEDAAMFLKESQPGEDAKSQ